MLSKFIFGSSVGCIVLVLIVLIYGLGIGALAGVVIAGERIFFHNDRGLGTFTVFGLSALWLLGFVKINLTK